VSDLNLIDSIGKSLNNDSKNKDNSLFSTGLGSIIFGSIIVTWFPAYTAVKIGFYALGGLTIGLHYLDKLDSKWDKIFRALGLYIENNDNKTLPKIVKKTKRDYGYDLLVSLPLGLSTDDFDKQKKKIEQHLNVKIDIEYCNKHVLIRVVEKKLKKLYLYKTVKVDHPLELLIGYIEHDKIKTLKLGHQTPHVLIGGMTGWGKTKFLIQMLVNIIKNTIPEKIDINLIDFKGVDYNDFKNCKHIKSLCDNINDAEKLIYKLIVEMNKRINFLKEANCHNLDQYNKSHKEKLPYILNIIDEYADLQDHPRIQKNIDELLRKARAVGIHLVLCTQRASREILPGTLKANMPVTIVFKTRNRVNSQIFLDSDSAAYLKHPGRGILLTDKEYEFQAMLIDDGEEKKWLNAS